MGKTLFTAIVSACQLLPVIGLADTYPKNFDIDIQHYQFKLWLSDRNDSVRAEATVFLNFKKAGIQQVRLDLTNVSSELQGKGMTVASIMSNGKTLSFSHRSDELLIAIPASVAGQQISITIKYSGIPDAGLAIKQNRYNDRSFFSDNWPNLGHHWLPLADHPYDKATCEFIVTAPSRYKVVSNGLLQEESFLLDGNKLTHWKQAVPIAPWLFVLGVAEFAVQYVDSFEGKSIETWVYRQDREAGFYDFQTPTKQALTFFSDYVGPFAYEKLANIQSNNSTGGMEAASAIMYSEKSVSGKRDVRWQDVIVHELAHQWFGDAVTKGDWDDVWLSEGFATYFTLLYTEHSKGRDEFVKGLKASREQIIKYLAINPDSPIVHNQLSDMEKVTSALTYQKGAWVLHMLRELMGEVNFKKGIQAYYKKYFNANATTLDFRYEMEQASGLDLKSFFSQWLYQTGMPTIKGQWTWDSKKKELKVTFEQTQQNAFSFPLEIGIASAGNTTSEVKKVNVTSKQSIFMFVLESKPGSVTLDPETTLLGVFDVSLKK
ncbi:MAG: M1 family peptidase [Cyclobacteriaceae bacterium]|nr:M1 family peptidase [Cyclobacteriaceae bacterium]